MAKTSVVVRGKVREQDVRRARVARAALKEIIRNPATDYDEKLAAVVKLNKQPRNESASRIQRRCRQCGRPHAVYRKFGLCRIHLREAAMRGDVPGLLKASW